MTWWQQLGILGEVALAMLLGGIIGAERESANKPAGFRTHLLVAGASAMLVGLADVFAARYQLASTDTGMRSDPIRIVEAIITGISFLGAGTIFRQRGEQVEGLTTAASLLIVGTIGIAVALRQYVLAVGITVLALVALRGVYLVQLRLKTKSASESDTDKK